MISMSVAEFRRDLNIAYRVCKRYSTSTMEQITGEITVAYTDDRVNEIIATSISDPVDYTRHFDQNEDFFIRIPDALTVPSIPIHHDVRRDEPEATYIEALEDFLRVVVSRRIPVFSGLTYMFDPAEIQRPAFYAVYEHHGMSFLFLLYLDLSYRPLIHEVVEQGSNDVSPRYKTNRLYLEADIVPLAQPPAPAHPGGGSRPGGFSVEQVVSQTWIGETGRGYFIQGIWLDRDLTKFFSKLFLPEGKRTYPYYPFTCKYRSICFSPIDLGPQERADGLPLLSAAREVLEPHISEIQDALKEQAFNEELSVFRRVKDQIDHSRFEPLANVKVTAYLNNADMKEFIVETG